MWKFFFNFFFLAEQQVVAFGCVPPPNPQKVYLSFTAPGMARGSWDPLSTAAFSWWNRSQELTATGMDEAGENLLLP